MMKQKTYRNLLWLIALISVVALTLTITLMSAAQEKQSLSTLQQEVKALESNYTQLQLQAEQLEQQIQETILAGEELEKRIAYLTFDDGPSENTDAILDTLQQYNVKATFFVTGYMIEQYPEQMKRMVKEGHSIASHTYSHEYDYIYANLENFQTDFKQANELIKSYTGKDVSIFRHPGGSSTTIGAPGVVNQTRHWLTEIGVNYTDWNVDSTDASGHNVPAQIIVDETLTQAANQSSYAVVLLHDTNAKATTLEALPSIIEGLQAQGYVLAAMPDGMDIPQHTVPQ